MTSLNAIPSAQPGSTYTTGEAARICGVNFRTVIRWIKRGVLAAHQLPGRGDNRIPASELARFLRAHNMAVPPELAGWGAEPSVLIVDDERAVASAIQRALRPGGFRCRTAGDGFRAGAMLALEKPDLVTLDLNMPGMDGFEVLAYIRKEPALAGVKVLVISALGRHELDRARRTGADEVLEKPFTNKALLEAARRLVAPAGKRKEMI